MTRACAWSFLVLPLLVSSAAPLLSQQSGIQPSVAPQNSETAGIESNSLTLMEAHQTACPVSILAQHGSGGSSTFLLSSVRPQKVSQQLHLVLRNGDAKRVVGVQLTLHGTGTKNSMVQTNAELIGVSSRTKTIHLGLAVAPKDEAAIDLSLAGFTSVQRVDLESVTYQDGTKWQASASGSCHFTPDATMLISSR